jgi:hypothetical protein
MMLPVLPVSTGYRQVLPMLLLAAAASVAALFLRPHTVCGTHSLLVHAHMLCCLACASQEKYIAAGRAGLIQEMCKNMMIQSLLNH